MTARLSAKTMPEFFEKRYASPKLKLFSAVIIFIFLIPYSASVYNGLSALFEIVFGISGWIIMIALAVLTAFSGLIINLHFPNLHWTNELVAVKQSLSPLVAMLIGWVLAGLAVGGWFLFGKYIGAWYLVVLLALFTVVSVCLWQWLKTRGKVLFENL
jgi:hypothetical protein